MTGPSAAASYGRPSSDQRDITISDIEVRVPVAETFALDDVGAAYDRFAAGGKLGKIVLLPG